MLEIKNKILGMKNKMKYFLVFILFVGTLLAWFGLLLFLKIIITSKVFIVSVIGITFFVVMLLFNKTRSEKNKSSPKTKKIMKYYFPFHFFMFILLVWFGLLFHLNIIITSKIFVVSLVVAAFIVGLVILVYSFISKKEVKNKKCQKQ